MIGICVALLVLTTAGSVPLNQNVGFIGEGTSDLAVKLLQSSKYENQAFSPLGYNTLLAIFAEGAKGETKRELADVLHLPESQEDVRLGYQTVLKRLSDKYKLNSPEMKNWFYIYRNFTVDEDIKNVIRKFYLTEVKEIDTPKDIDYEGDKFSKVKVPAGLQGKPTDHLINVDEDVSSIIDSSVNSPHKSDGEEAMSGMQPAMFDEKKQAAAAIKEMEKDKELVKPEELLQGSANNNEKVLPEKELGKDESEKEKVVLKEEMKKEDEDKLKEKVETKKDEKATEEKETMLAMQRHIDAENEINGDIEGFVKVKGQGNVPRILAFNGFFFKGQWSFTFTKRAADESRPFYTTAGKAIVPTLQAEGVFRTAEIPELDGKAVELKYDGDRYSMLILVPNKVDGITKMDFKDLPLKKITERLSEKPIDLCMPCFDVMTISKPSLYGLKLGLDKVLKPELADLSGFSKEPGLYLDELVQVVTVEVNTNSTETVLLTASLASSRGDLKKNHFISSVASSRIDLEKFEVNKPFYFFIRDNIDDIVIVNGLVVDPSVRSDMRMFS